LLCFFVVFEWKANIQHCVFFCLDTLRHSDNTTLASRVVWKCIDVTQDSPSHSSTLTTCISHTVLPQLLHFLTHTQNQITKCPSTMPISANSPPNTLPQTTTTTTRQFASFVMELHFLYTCAVSPRDVVLNEDVFSRIKSLLYTLMFCHSGYPELYSTLLSLHFSLLMYIHSHIYTH
jgi:hypothetical protein